MLLFLIIEKKTFLCSFCIKHKKFCFASGSRKKFLLCSFLVNTFLLHATIFLCKESHPQEILTVSKKDHKIVNKKKKENFHGKVNKVIEAELNIHRD